MAVSVAPSSALTLEDDEERDVLGEIASSRYTPTTETPSPRVASPRVGARGRGDDLAELGKPTLAPIPEADRAPEVGGAEGGDRAEREETGGSSLGSETRRRVRFGAEDAGAGDSRGEQSDMTDSDEDEDSEEDGEDGASGDADDELAGYHRETSRHTQTPFASHRDTLRDGHDDPPPAAPPLTPEAFPIAVDEGQEKTPTDAAFDQLLGGETPDRSDAEDERRDTVRDMDVCELPAAPPDTVSGTPCEPAPARRERHIPSRSRSVTGGSSLRGSVSTPLDPDFAAMVTGERYGYESVDLRREINPSAAGTEHSRREAKLLHNTPESRSISRWNSHSETTESPDHTSQRGTGSRLNRMVPLPPIHEIVPRISKATSLRNGGRIYGSNLSTSLPNLGPSMLSPRHSDLSLTSRATGNAPRRRFEKFSYSMVMYPELKPPPSVATQTLAPIQGANGRARRGTQGRVGFKSPSLTPRALNIHNTTNRSVAYYQHEGAVIVDSVACLHLLGQADCGCPRCTAKKDIVKRLAKPPRGKQQQQHRKQLKDKKGKT